MSPNSIHAVEEELPFGAWEDMPDPIGEGDEGERRLEKFAAEHDWLMKSREDARDNETDGVPV